MENVLYVHIRNDKYKLSKFFQQTFSVCIESQSDVPSNTQKKNIIRKDLGLRVFWVVANERSHIFVHGKYSDGC